MQFGVVADFESVMKGSDTYRGGCRLTRAAVQGRPRQARHFNAFGRKRWFAKKSASLRSPLLGQSRLLRLGRELRDGPPQPHLGPPITIPRDKRIHPGVAPKSGEHRRAKLPRKG